MTAFPLSDIACTCQRGELLDAVTGHALTCPTHAALMAELFKPNPRENIMIDQPPAAPPNIHWRVVYPPDGYSVEFYAPHCNADAQGLLAVGGPGEVLAIFAPGQWSRIENMDAKGADGVARVSG